MKEVLRNLKETFQEPFMPQTVREPVMKQTCVKLVLKKTCPKSGQQETFRKVLNEGSIVGDCFECKF
jgi:hypothetical protein